MTVEGRPLWNLGMFSGTTDWMETVSGVKFYLLDPRPEDKADIAEYRALWLTLMILH